MNKQIFFPATPNTQENKREYRKYAYARHCTLDASDAEFSGLQVEFRYLMQRA